FAGALRKIEARGHHESAHRAKQKCGQVFRNAIAAERAEHDVSSDLRGALMPGASRNHAALSDPAEIGALLHAINSYEGQPARNGGSAETGSACPHAPA